MLLCRGREGQSSHHDRGQVLVRVVKIKSFKTDIFHKLFKIQLFTYHAYVISLFLIARERDNSFRFTVPRFLLLLRRA